MNCFALDLLQDDYPKPFYKLVEYMESYCTLCEHQEECKRLFDERDETWDWEKEWDKPTFPEHKTGGDWLTTTLRTGRRGYIEE